MAKNKKVFVPSTAGSSESKDGDNLKSLQKEIAKSRKEIDKLRVELALLPTSISLIKNQNASVVAGSSQSEEIKKLKALNNQLVAEVAESRKQINLLHFELASSAADKNILADIQSNVFKLVLSSSFVNLVDNLKSRDAHELTMMKTAAAEDLVREKKDVIQMDMELAVEERDSCLQSSEKAKKTAHRELGRRFWNKFIYPIVIAAATALASFSFLAVVKFFLVLDLD